MKLFRTVRFRQSDVTHSPFTQTAGSRST